MDLETVMLNEIRQRRRYMQNLKRNDPATLFPGHYSGCSSSLGPLQARSGELMPQRQPSPPSRWLKFSVQLEECWTSSLLSPRAAMRATAPGATAGPSSLRQLHKGPLQSQTHSLTYVSWGHLPNELLILSPFLRLPSWRPRQQAADCHWRFLSKLETDNPNGLVPFIRQCLCKAQTGLEDEGAGG